MENQFFIKLFKVIFCTGILYFFTVYTAGYLLALPMNTLDSAGMPLYIEKEIEDAPDQFLKIIKKELETGNLESIGFIAKTLNKTMQNNPDVKALYSIYLVSKGDIITAKKELKKAVEYQKNNIYALYAEAMIKQREKEYYDAEKICKKAILKDKFHPYPRNILGRIYFDIGKYKKAYASFKKAIELVPEFLPGYSNLGAVCFTMGKNEEAIAYFKKTINLNPDSFGAHYGLAIVYETTGNNALALNAYKRSFELDSSNTALLSKIANLQILTAGYKDAQKTGQQMLNRKIEGAHEILGSSALHMGDVKEAITQLQKAPAESLDAAYLMGYCLIVNGEYDKALKQMEKIYKENNLHFGAYAAKAALLFYLNKGVNTEKDLKNKWNKGTEKLLNFISGCVYGSEDKWVDAEKEFHAAEGLINGFSIKGIDTDLLAKGLKKDELKYIAMGVLLYITNLNDNSLAEFNKAIKINKDSILANYWAAQVYLKKGDRDNAITYFENSLKKAPTFFSSLYVTGELNFMKGETITAADYYESALAVKKDTGLMIKLGLFYEYTKKYDKAAEFYGEVTKLSPDNFIGYNQLAWLYAKRGVKLDKAMDLAIKADNLQPRNTSILDTIGWIYYHKKKYSKALEYLEKAQKINSNNPSVLYHLGVVYNNLGDHDTAKDFLRKSLEISESFEGADDARKLLKQ